MRTVKGSQTYRRIWRRARHIYVIRKGFEVAYVDHVGADLIAEKAGRSPDLIAQRIVDPLQPASSAAPTAFHGIAFIFVDSSLVYS